MNQSRSGQGLVQRTLAIETERIDFRSWRPQFPTNSHGASAPTAICRRRRSFAYPNSAKSRVDCPNPAKVARNGVQAVEWRALWPPYRRRSFRRHRCHGGKPTGVGPDLRTDRTRPLPRTKSRSFCWIKFNWPVPSGRPAYCSAAVLPRAPGRSACHSSRKAPCMCAADQRLRANSLRRHHGTTSVSPPPDQRTS